MGFQCADGLKQDGAGLGDGGLIREFGGHNERHFAGINRVVAAVQQCGLHADHRVTGQHAVLGGLTDALLDCREEVLRHAAAEHVLGKLDALALDGLELDPDVAELAVAAGLFLVAALRLAALADGLTVRHARILERDLDAELILQLGQRDLQMLGAQTADDLLLRLGVDHEPDGGVLLDQAGQRAADLTLVTLLCDLDSHTVAADGVHRCGQRHNAGGVTQGIAGLGGGQLGNCADVTGGDFGRVGLLFAADGQRLAQALRLAGAGVDGVARRGQPAGQHLNKAQFADKRVGHSLKDVGAQRGGGVGGDLHRLAARLAHGGRGVRAGQQHVHVVEQHIQRLRVDGRAAEHGRDLAAAYAGGHALDDLLCGESLTLEELLHQSLVGLGDGLAHGLDQALKTVADVGQVDLDLLAAFVFEGLLAEQVDVGDGAVVQTDGHDAGADTGAEFNFHLLQDLKVVGVFQISLGDKDHPRLVVFQRQLVRLLGTDGHAGTPGHTDQHALGGHDALGSAGLKIKQTRCVDQVVLDALVLDGDNARVERCLAADLLGVKVAGRGAVLDTAHTLGSAAHVQQCLGQRRFAAAGVAGHQNVADVFACVAHGSSNLFSRRGCFRQPCGVEFHCGAVIFEHSRLFDTTLPHCCGNLNSFFGFFVKIFRQKIVESVKNRSSTYSECRGRALLARQLGAASSFRENISQGKRARAGNARPYQSFLCRSVQQKKPHSFHCTA